MKNNGTKNDGYLSSLEDLPYLLTIEMVARLTGLNYETIKRHCRSGEIEGVKIGREWRISQDAFRKLGNRTFDKATDSR